MQKAEGLVIREGVSSLPPSHLRAATRLSGPFPPATPKCLRGKHVPYNPMLKMEIIFLTPLLMDK
jgi:hypothetical protein